MGLERITQKLQEALQSAQSIASKSAHPELKSAHVLLALLQQDGGITVPILQKAGVDVTRLKAAVAAALSREPSVQGASNQPQLSVGLRATLESADAARESMGDDYLSVEHFILGSLKGDSPAGKLLKEAGLDETKAAEAIKGVRGSQKVTDENPEGKYQTLEKSTATMRSAGFSKCFPAAPRTTPCSSASRVSARPPSSKDWPAELFPAMCRTR
jgi:ATP-dependent Clp protease ATP-binding subunit ClpB